MGPSIQLMSQMDDIRDKVVQAWDLIHKRPTISTRDNWASNCGPCMVSNEVLDVFGCYRVGDHVSAQMWQPGLFACIGYHRLKSMSTWDRTIYYTYTTSEPSIYYSRLEGLLLRAPSDLKMKRRSPKLWSPSLTQSSFGQLGGVRLCSKNAHAIACRIHDFDEEFVRQIAYKTQSVGVHFSSH